MSSLLSLFPFFHSTLYFWTALGPESHSSFVFLTLAFYDLYDLYARYDRLFIED